MFRLQVASLCNIFSILSISLVCFILPIELFLKPAACTTMAQYNNAVLSVTKVTTPDPYVTYANNKFYLVSYLRPSLSTSLLIICDKRHSQPATESRSGRPTA